MKKLFSILFLALIGSSVVDASRIQTFDNSTPSASAAGSGPANLHTGVHYSVSPHTMTDIYNFSEKSKRAQ